MLHNLNTSSTNRRCLPLQSIGRQCFAQSTKLHRFLVARRQQHDSIATSTGSSQFTGKSVRFTYIKHSLQTRMRNAQRAQQIVVDSHKPFDSWEIFMIVGGGRFEDLHIWFYVKICLNKLIHTFVNTPKSRPPLTFPLHSECDPPVGCAAPLVWQPSGPVLKCCVRLPCWPARRSRAHAVEHRSVPLLCRILASDQQYRSCYRVRMDCRALDVPSKTPSSR